MGWNETSVLDFICHEQRPALPGLGWASSQPSPSIAISDLCSPGAQAHRAQHRRAASWGAWQGLVGTSSHGSGGENPWECGGQGDVTETGGDTKGGSEGRGAVQKHLSDPGAGAQSRHRAPQGEHCQTRWVEQAEKGVVMVGKCKLELQQHTQRTARRWERKSTGMEQGKCHIL